jgi:serine/threonine-protein kinase
MPSDPRETTVVRTIGRYRAFGELGRGAMGVVYRGFDPLIGRTVALKTLSIDTSDPQAREFRDRLYREAAAAGALSHPNIVTIFDIVEDAGLTAVAMEFIEGRSLAAIIAERAPLPIDLAVEILDQIGSALDYAGSQSIVHRDIKPANILMTSAGRAKVTDFGVARLALSTMTQAGTVLGSPSYMSPEQVKGLSLDGRSDLFSAAVVFFEMITRERPFAGNDIATTMYRIAHEPPTPPSQFNPAIGPAVAAVLERAFAKNPADRFQTGADLVAELRTAAELGPSRGPSPALAALATAPPPVPPIVMPLVHPGAAAAPGHAGVPDAPAIPATSSAPPAGDGSGAQALAPIPESVLSAALPGAGVASSVDLPAIPLPPEPAAAPTPATAAPVKPQSRAQVKAASKPAGSSRRGLAVGAIAVLIVGAGIAGALFLRGGAAVPAADPAASVAEPPPQPMPEPAGAVPIPESQPPAAPPTTAAVPPGAATAAGRGASGAAAKTPGAAQPRPGTKPLPTQPALATQGPGAAVVPAPAAPAAPPPPASSSRIYQTVEVDVRPEVVAQVRPVYPEEAAKQSVQDVVVLQVLVDTAGRPESIKVLRGSRRAPSLDEAATAAVRQWTFRPAKKNGQPVPCWFNVGVPFPPKAP